MRRIVTITERELALFAKLFEDADTPALAARLPQVHSQEILHVLERFAAVERRLGDLQGEYLATEMFHESNSQRDGIITRQDNPSFQPTTADEWVISGPHFYVGTPLNKSPRTQCTANTHYDDIDLTEIPEDYLPRAVYRPGDRDGDLTAFYNAIPEWPRPSHPGFWPVRDDEISLMGDDCSGKKSSSTASIQANQGRRPPVDSPILVCGKGQSRRHWPGCDSTGNDADTAEFARRFGLCGCSRRSRMQRRCGSCQYRSLHDIDISTERRAKPGE